MKLFEMKKEKDSIEFIQKDKRIMKVKIAATAVFQTEDDEVAALFSGKEDEIIIRVLLEKLTFKDFYLENIDELSKAS